MQLANTTISAKCSKFLLKFKKMFGFSILEQEFVEGGAKWILEECLLGRA